MKQTDKIPLHCMDAMFIHMLRKLGLRDMTQVTQCHNANCCHRNSACLSCFLCEGDETQGFMHVKASALPRTLAPSLRSEIESLTPHPALLPAPHLSLHNASLMSLGLVVKTLTRITLSRF